MSRLPVRLRLTVAFALAMAVVLVAVGAILYVRLGNALEEQLDESLELRADSLAALVRSGGDLSGRDLGSADDEAFAQLLRPDGTVLASSRGAGSDARVDARELARGRAARVLLERGTARVLLVPVESGGEGLVLAVGASLEDRDEALAGLLAQLLVVGPIALALASLAGYLLAAAALRPVEAMRRQADGVTSEDPGRRLPLPAARDEVHRLGRTLNAMLGRLEDGLARERRFVADASHELRTPLALLQTELELALRRPRSREELERALRSAAEEVDRLTGLAEDLLVLARLGEGRMPLRYSTTRARELLEGVARRFEPRAAAELRTLAVDVSDGLVVEGDRLRLEQALGNLVDNALRHASGTVRLQGTRRDGRVELGVSDGGAGFPPAFLPRAFDRFARADDARGGNASGLGLAIVAAIARAHGGAARAENSPAGGAVVTLTLPAGPESDAREPGLSAAPRGRDRGAAAS